MINIPSDEEINNLFDTNEINNNFIKKVGNCYLTNNEIEVLNRYNIDYLKCKSNHELLYLVEECLEDIDAEDLEWLSGVLSERSYYLETKK
mgnify:CR=1 FL=1